VIAGTIARRRQVAESVNQLDRANETISRMMEGTNQLQEIRSDQNNQIAVLTKERDSAIKERDDALDQLHVLHDPTRIEGLRVKIDAM
jgi:hypothetical protein